MANTKIPTSLLNDNVRVQIVTNTTFTVGLGGDYAEIADACYDIYNKYYPKSIDGGLNITVNCLTGYVMTKRLYISNGIDMGFIKITSTDASVKVDPTSWGYQIKEIFYAVTNSRLPILSTLFDAENKRNSLSQTIGGVMLSKNSSCSFAESLSYGIINCTYSCVHASDNSRFTTQKCLFTGGGIYGVAASNGSVLSLRDSNCQKGASPASTDINVFNGAIVCAKGATGGVNQTANTPTADGIIFK